MGSVVVQMARLTSGLEVRELVIFDVMIEMHDGEVHSRTAFFARATLVLLIVVGVVAALLCKGSAVGDSTYFATVTVAFKDGWANDRLPVCWVFLIVYRHNNVIYFGMVARKKFRRIVLYSVLKVQTHEGTE